MIGYSEGISPSHSHSFYEQFSLKSLFDAINLDEMGEPLSQQAAGEGKHDVQRQVAHTRGRLESPNSLTSAFLLGGNLKKAHAGVAGEADSSGTGN